MNDPESRRTTVTVDGAGVGVRYLRAGSGPPVVLVHGIGIDAASVSWRHVLPVLAEERTVYALDLPGHGESDKPRRRYTTAYFESVLEAFLDAEGLTGAPLVGVSMGGAVVLGQALSETPPERIALIDSYGLGGDAYWRAPASAALWTPGLGQYLFSGVGGSRAAVRSSLAGLTGSPPDDAFVDDVYEAVRDPPVRRTMRRWQRSEFRPTGLRTDYSDRLGEIDVPTLLVHGAEDPLLPPAWSRRAHEALPASALHVLDGCGHWPPREQPQVVTELLTAFLAGERGPASD
ncbi:alpha/beta fold hydrolase [Halapricum sp. CBA1109]|uniref:alpha/beta fold hydrolase n=1 Tax=Halapricum sp. CBA1109 TaxID=2668068 RepID=UPI0012FCD9CE|nr:alpha/beta fold hydrolase [Halapricum sp. CBA1109]MUV90634.1 alpha/beta fold hydrolase [Halapricum sp. CBA1109]